jgi:hypothetical protein
MFSVTGLVTFCIRACTQCHLKWSQQLSSISICPVHHKCPRLHVTATTEADQHASQASMQVRLAYSTFQLSFHPCKEGPVIPLNLSCSRCGACGVIQVCSSPWLPGHIAPHLIDWHMLKLGGGIYISLGKLLWQRIAVYTRVQRVVLAHCRWASL